MVSTLGLGRLSCCNKRKRRLDTKLRGLRSEEAEKKPKRRASIGTILAGQCTERPRRDWLAWVLTTSCTPTNRGFFDVLTPSCLTTKKLVVLTLPSSRITTGGIKTTTAAVPVYTAGTCARYLFKQTQMHCYGGARGGGQGGRDRRLIHQALACGLNSKEVRSPS